MGSPSWSAGSRKRVASITAFLIVMIVGHLGSDMEVNQAQALVSLPAGASRWRRGFPRVQADWRCHRSTAPLPSPRVSSLARSVQ